MANFYIAIYKGEVVLRKNTAKDLIYATSRWASENCVHAPTPCMVSNDIEACSEWTHINYEETEDNNSTYGFKGSDATFRK